MNLFESVASVKDERFAQRPDFTLITFDDIPEAEKRFEHARLPGVKHLSFRNQGMVKNMLFLTRNFRTLLQGYDIIHVRSYLPMVPAMRAKSAFGTKVIFDMRGVLPEETLLRKKSRLQYWLLRQLERRACRRADCIVVVSEAFRDVVAERCAGSDGKIRVVPTFSTNSLISAPTPGTIPALRADIFRLPGARIFVYSGAFEKWQCAEQVVQFFKLAAARFPEARFVILSRNTAEFARLMEASFEPGIYYIANAPNDQLVHYLRQCDYGLLFREKNLINKVAAPIKFKDYLSAGVPVILTAGIGDYPKYTREHGLGFILEELTETEYKKVLETIAGSAAIDREKTEAAAAMLFDVEKAARYYLEIYAAISKVPDAEPQTVS